MVVVSWFPSRVSWVGVNARLSGQQPGCGPAGGIFSAQLRSAAWHRVPGKLGACGTAELPVCRADTLFFLPFPLLQPHDIRAQVSAAQIQLPGVRGGCWALRHGAACPRGRVMPAEPWQSGNTKVLGALKYN